MPYAEAASWFPWSALSFPFLLFVVTRIALFGSSYMSMLFVPTLYMHENQRHQYLVSHPAWDGLCRWDCTWFEQIILHGFQNREMTKVFPLFAVLGGMLAKVANINHLVALIIVANLASLASYIVIHRLFSRVEGEAAARLGVLMFAAYPFAFFQGAAYPESMMTLMSSGALLLATRGRHIRAGVVLGLGMMARHITLFAGAGLVAAQLRQRGLRRFFPSVPFFGLVVPFLFLAVWSWYLGKKVGDPFAYWNMRSYNFGPSVFWSVREVFINVRYADRPELYFYMVFSLIPLGGTIALLTKKRWVELAAAAAVLMCVVYGSGGIALGRYSAACWPAFLPYGVALARRRELQAPIAGLLFFFQGLFFFLFAHQWRIL